LPQFTECKSYSVMIGRHPSMMIMILILYDREFLRCLNTNRNNRQNNTSIIVDALSQFVYLGFEIGNSCK